MLLPIVGARAQSANSLPSTNLSQKIVTGNTFQLGLGFRSYRRMYNDPEEGGLVVPVVLVVRDPASASVSTPKLPSRKN